jgi:hypothetical protein
MVHAALLLLMLEAVHTDLVFTISLKRSTQNLQLSTSSPADYPIFGHVWTAPPWQELSELLQHWSGAVMCPACLCGGEAIMLCADRVPIESTHSKLTHAGSLPDPRIDLVCITSSCPRQFLQNFKTPSSLPGLTSLSSSFDTTSLYRCRRAGAVHSIKNGHGGARYCANGWMTHRRGHKIWMRWLCRMSRLG